MTPISNRDNSSISGNDGGADDPALKALIPFSGAYSPHQIRSRMAGPSLNGPTGAIWTRTTIQYSNADGSFCLYACERTGEAMWVPSGEYFAADRSRGAQSRGTVMDYLVSQRQRAQRPAGYGIHHVKPLTPSNNWIRQGPKRYAAKMMVRTSLQAASGSCFNPIARSEPSNVGAASRRTVARRERREKGRAQYVPLSSSQTNTATATSSFKLNATTPAPTSKTNTSPPSRGVSWLMLMGLCKPNIFRLQHMKS